LITLPLAKEDGTEIIENDFQFQEHDISQTGHFCQRVLAPGG
jgi:hypothetical protein